MRSEILSFNLTSIHAPTTKWAITSYRDRSTAYSIVQLQKTLRVLTFTASGMSPILTLLLLGVKARFAGNSDSGARGEITKFGMNRTIYHSHLLIGPHLEPYNTLKQVCHSGLCFLTSHDFATTLAIDSLSGNLTLFHYA